MFLNVSSKSTVWLYCLGTANQEQLLHSSSLNILVCTVLLRTTLGTNCLGWMGGFSHQSWALMDTCRNLELLGTFNLHAVPYPAIYLLYSISLPFLIFPYPFCGPELTPTEALGQNMCLCVDHCCCTLPSTMRARFAVPFIPPVHLRLLICALTSYRPLRDQCWYLPLRPNKLSLKHSYIPAVPGEKGGLLLNPDLLCYWNGNLSLRMFTNSAFQTWLTMTCRVIFSFHSKKNPSKSRN